MSIHLSKVLILGLSLLLSLTVIGCGGSGGSNNGATGNVAIMMTDAPTDDYDQILLSITAIELLTSEDSQAGSITLFSGNEVIDLLQLRNHAELFTVAEGVPVNDYALVRLYVDQVELVDTRTSPETRDIARLPSGKLDLIARNSLSVNEDQTLYLEIDIDASNSLLVVDDGNAELLFRPVAFLAGFTDEQEPLDGEAQPVIDQGWEGTPLITVQGRLRGMDEQQRPLLCPPTANAAQAACTPLLLDQASVAYDTQGEVIDLVEQEVGTPLLAMGLLERDSADGRRTLALLSAVVGERPMVGTRGGHMGSVQQDGLYQLVNGRTFSLLEQAPVINQQGELLSSNSLDTAGGLTLMGRVDSNPMQAALVVLTEEEGTSGTANARQVLHGELISVDSVDTLQMVVGEQTQWVRLIAEGSLVVSGNGRVADADLQTLQSDHPVRLTVIGQAGSEYFEAIQIIAITMGPSERIVSGGGAEHAGRPENPGRPDHARTPSESAND